MKESKGNATNQKHATANEGCPKFILREFKKKIDDVSNVIVVHE
jgi:hypothetical protein